MRRRARVDENHGDIVQALKDHGWLVLSLASVGRGCPDVLAWHAGHGLNLFEIKTAKGTLTPDQERFKESGWPFTVLRCTDDVTAYTRDGL